MNFLFKIILILIISFFPYCSNNKNKNEILIPCYQTDSPVEKTASINKIIFFDTNHGWAIAEKAYLIAPNNLPYAYSTTDGGFTWNELKLLPSIAATNDSYFSWNINSWATNSVAIFKSNSFHTTDNGTTWKEHFHEYNLTIRSGYAFTYYPNYSEGKFFDANIAYRAGTYKWTNIYPVFSKTTDGGNSWTRSDPDISSLGSKVGFLGSSFPSSTTGWLLISSWNDYTTQIIKTIDFGNNWNVQYSQINNYTVSPYSSIDKIYFFDTLQGWAYGKNKFIYTTNGGTNWTPISTPMTSSDTSNILYFKFITSSTGYGLSCNYISSQCELFKSTDGGLNWMSLKILPYNYYKMEILDSTHIWVIDGNNIIFTSDEFSSSQVISSISFNYTEIDKVFHLGWPWFCF